MLKVLKKAETQIMMKYKTYNSRFIFDIPIEVNWKYGIKKILAPLFDCLYRTTLYFNRPKNSEPKKYNLSVCAIFKDEGFYLKEWLEHNHLVGVEHFYLYNNFSGDNYQEVLAPYIDKGLVTLVEFPVKEGQFPAYEHFWQNYRNETQWVAFIDIDEFFCPYYVDNLSDWIAQYINQPSVVVYWKMFGTSGKLEHNSSQLTTEQYTISWDRMYIVGKAFVNTQWDFARIYHHNIGAKCRFLGRIISVPSVDEFGHYLRLNIDRKVSRKKDFTIQLNHYWSRSYDSYVKGKVERGDVNNHLRNAEVFFWHERNNRDVDYKIFRFMIKLKLSLNKSR